MIDYIMQLNTYCDGVEVDACEAINDIDHFVDGLGRFALLGNHLHWPIDIVWS